MITLRKLESLEDKVCARKTAIVLHEAALGLFDERPVDYGYIRSLREVFALSKVRELISEDERHRLDDLSVSMERERGRDLAFVLEDVSQLLFAVLGAEPSDWDFTDRNGNLDVRKRIVKPHGLVLDRLRSPFNVGSVFRSADSFGIRDILLVEGTADPAHPRCVRTSRGTVDTVSHKMLDEGESMAFLKDKPVFALELGGVDIHAFPFPSEGYAVIGSEEMGVSPALLSLCDHSLGRVSIPLCGTKGSLNVSVAVGILLYNWL